MFRAAAPLLTTLIDCNCQVDLRISSSTAHLERHSLHITPFHTKAFHLPLFHLGTNLTRHPLTTLTDFTKNTTHQSSITLLTLPLYTSHALFTDASAHSLGPHQHVTFVYIG